MGARSQTVESMARSVNVVSFISEIGKLSSNAYNVKSCRGGGVYDVKDILKTFEGQTPYFNIRIMFVNQK